jgi:8-oxo-dGTP pyrophosphatase MutT (NUDIX family)
MNILPVWLGRIVYWIIWPGTWLYLRWSTRTRVIISYRGEIMVVRKWLSNGKYHLPGGGVEGDESAAHGAVRELYEETELTLHEAEVELLSTETYRSSGMSFNCHYFVYWAGSRPVTKPKFPEITEVAWLDRLDIHPDTCSPEVIRPGTAGLVT